MTDQATEILWIVPKWPLPADDGARQATSQLLRHLAKAGARIHLCAVVPRDETIDTREAASALGVESSVVIRRSMPTIRSRLWALLKSPGTALTVAPYATDEVASRLSGEILQHRGAIVVFDGLHGAGLLMGKWGGSLEGRSVVYRAHNAEADLWRRAAMETRNPARRLFLFFQARLVRMLESRLARRAQVVFPVSEVDSVYFREVAPDSRVIALPIGMEVGPPPPSRGAAVGRNLLFVGRLDWLPNREGLRWFLEEVWPTVVARDADLGLTIVGSGDGSWLRPYVDGRRVRFLGRVESLDEQYAKCLATIVPVFYGSGTRVKAIEASLRQVPCISTSLGVEGIGLTEGQSYFRVERAEDWVRCLLSLDAAECRRVAQSAYEVVAQRFDPAKVARDFMAALGDGTRRPLQAPRPGSGRPLCPASPDCEAVPESCTIEGNGGVSCVP